MPVYYLDTSALVKRYFAEIGTGWVQSITDPATGNLLFTREPPLTIVAADGRLFHAAGVHLQVENPESYP